MTQITGGWPVRLLVGLNEGSGVRMDQGLRETDHTDNLTDPELK